MDCLVCHPLDSHYSLQVPLSKVSAITLKIYTGKWGKFHKFEDVCGRVIQTGSKLSLIWTG